MTAATVAKPRFRAVWLEYMGCWGIEDAHNIDGRYVSTGLTKAQAEMGVTLLKNDAIDTSAPDYRFDLDHELQEVLCEVCEKHFMRCQVHGERCPSCLS